MNSWKAGTKACFGFNTMQEFEKIEPAPELLLLIGGFEEEEVLLATLMLQQIFIPLAIPTGRCYNKTK
ncbi:MAG TPA: hypothetical protein DCZ00_03900 [Lactococcus sp.]|uniref:hypothetical protein n=1 Tax=Lactococcus TaxID=1357 RepID=UPI000E8C5823|nr:MULTISPECIES: hypothetical protein [Lactococcus]HBC90572.1 hypothetical protein [Lactococcus sp.]